MISIIFYIIITSLFSFLLGCFIKNKIKPFKPETYKELIVRTLSWILMILTMSAFFYFGKISTIIFFAFISFFVFKEFISITPTNWKDYYVLAFSFYVVIPFQYYLVSINYYGMTSILIPVYAFGLVPAIMALVGFTDDFLGRVSKIQWGQFIAIYNISYIPSLYMLNNDKTIHSLNLIIYLLIITQFSDISQFICGKLFGKHKISASVSPNKTVEGLIGGAVCSIILGILLHKMTPFSVASSALISFTLVICGFLGGLSLSGVKRSLNVKDWGRTIPGHGGFMDRMDSLVFSAPIFFHIIRYFYG